MCRILRRSFCMFMRYEQCRNYYKASKWIEKLKEEVSSDGGVGILFASATPLSNFSLDEQRHVKETKVHEVLCSTSALMRKNNSNLPFLPPNSFYGTLEPMVQVPSKSGYRSKCEFVFGYDQNRRPVVGLSTRSLRGIMNNLVFSADDCSLATANISTMDVVRAAQTFLDCPNNNDPLLVPFHPNTSKGFYRSLVVRQFSSGMMIILTVNPENVPLELRTRVKERFANWLFRGILPQQPLKGFSSQVNGDFCTKVQHPFTVASLFYDEVTGPIQKMRKERFLLVEGLPFAYEHLSPPKDTENNTAVQFRISPKAFFQINKSAAEILYRTVANMCRLDLERTTFLDVCCGTGTIGIMLAPSVKQVIGFDICQEAIEDAKFNAELNGLSSKCQYHVGRAEEMFPELIRKGLVPKSTSSDDNGAAAAHVIAVLNPIRQGLHESVIVALRTMESLKQLIYISCDAYRAQENFRMLCCATSRRFPGRHFTMRRIVPIDMFPQTRHFELVILFERD